jgi:prepilin-type processing-associated H-X9-DG protein
LYLEDNEGHLPHDQYGTWWILTGRTFKERRNGRVLAPREYHPVSTRGMLCPEAKRPSELATGGGVWGFGGQSWDVERYLGSTFEAWKVTITGAGAPLVGSYGLNGRLFLPPGDPEEVSRPITFLLNEVRSYTDVFSMRGRNAIPLLLDCVTVSGAPTAESRPPHQEPKAGLPPGPSNSPMANFCINRHSGYVNGLFLDWSVRKVGLKELWTLKWHEDFNTRGRWTRAGGVQPGDWPQWMRKFKDY